MISNLLIQVSSRKILAGAFSLALLVATPAAAMNYIGVTTDTDVTTVINLGARTITSNNGTGVITFPNAAAFEAALGGTFTDATADYPATWGWKSGETNVLQEIVIITNGHLYIEPNSIVRGQPSVSGSFNPGTLVIARGAKIFAAGDADNPIIFTGAGTGAAGTVRAVGATPAFWDADPVNAPKPATDAGKWGGVIILGNALVNSDRQPATAAQEYFDIDGLNTVSTDDRFTIEGIPAGGTANIGGFDRFGGFATEDNSGKLSYVSIRHGGANLAADNEINGLTLGAVGRGTTINYIEIWGNTDDGIEIFGGSVNLDHVAVFGQQDDGLDFDVGYTGTVQFALVINSNQSDKLVEWDGSYQGETIINGVVFAAAPVAAAFLPTAQFTVANATLIGNNGGTALTSSGLHIRDQAAPRFVNSIVVNPSLQGTTGPVEFDNSASGGQATQNLLDKEVSYLKGISFYTNLATYAATPVGFIQSGALGNVIPRVKLSDPKFENTFNSGLPSFNPGTFPGPNLAALGGNAFDPELTSDIAASLPDQILAADSSLTVVSYRGAFESNGSRWTNGWTAAQKFTLIK